MPPRETPSLDDDAGALAPVELRSEHLEAFRRGQRLAYACLMEVEKHLREGVTECAIAKLIEEYLGDHGVREYFHRPLVWFGERTVFKNVRRAFEFLPTKKCLESGMPVIFDVAPVVDGHSADVGFACKLGENALHDQMVRDLALYRRVILAGVRARKNLSDIYLDVDRLIEKQGYQNRHCRQPMRALAHRVSVVRSPGDRSRMFCDFGAPALRALLGRTDLATERSGPLSVWDGSRRSERPPDTGVWAVEPHLGFHDVGVKLEELLVITRNDAYWLDEDLPHARSVPS